MDTTGSVAFWGGNVDKYNLKMSYLETTGLQVALGFGSEEEMEQYQRGDERYFEIIGLALREHLTYLDARRRMYADHVSAQRPSGKVQLYNKGMSFGQVSRLKREMWNQTGG